MLIPFEGNAAKGYVNSDSIKGVFEDLEGQICLFDDSKGTVTGFASVLEAVSHFSACDPSLSFVDLGRPHELEEDFKSAHVLERSVVAIGLASRGDSGDFACFDLEGILYRSALKTVDEAAALFK